jgi:RNA polymerase sigma-70 factor (ECF subfamily)
VSTCATVAANIATETTTGNPDSILDLVSRAKQGDQEAFAALYELHRKRVYSLCLRMTGDVHEAEDLAQDAFIHVFRKLDTFRGDSTFSTWLYRVAFNTVLMRLRKRQLRPISLDEPVRLDSSVVARDVGCSDLELLGTVDRIALDRAIQELPPGCRTIFLLHEVEGYEHREIASLLRCSVGNSKSQLHKARLRMRELLASKQAAVTKRAVAMTSRVTSKSTGIPALMPPPSPASEISCLA